MKKSCQNTTITNKYSISISSTVFYSTRVKKIKKHNIISALNVWLGLICSVKFDFYFFFMSVPITSMLQYFSSLNPIELLNSLEPLNNFFSLLFNYVMLCLLIINFFFFFCCLFRFKMYNQE